MQIIDCLSPVKTEKQKSYIKKKQHKKITIDILRFYAILLQQSNLGVQLSWQSSGLQNRVPGVRVPPPLPSAINPNFITVIGDAFGFIVFISNQTKGFAILRTLQSLYLTICYYTKSYYRMDVSLKKAINYDILNIIKKR